MKNLSSFVFIFFFLFSCASGEENKNSYLEREYEFIIEYKDDSSDFLTIIAKFDLKNKYAKFYGLSSINTKVFELVIKDDTFEFNADNMESKGKLSSFKMFPISKAFIFDTLPNLKKKQSFTRQDGVRVEIVPSNSFY